MRRFQRIVGLVLVATSFELVGSPDQVASWLGKPHDTTFTPTQRSKMSRSARLYGACARAARRSSGHPYEQLYAARARRHDRCKAPLIMASTEAKAGFGIAWLLGIPLPILLIVYLVTRC